MGLALLLGSLSGPALAAPPLVLADGTLNPEWHFVGLPNQRKPATRFLPERIDGHSGVRVEADQSYGNWVHALPAPMPIRSLRWHWRVDTPNPKAVLAEKEGDDTPARVCVSFDLPLSQLPFIERQKLQIARSISGIDIAAETLCYVWTHAEAKGSVIPSAFTRRMRQIVLRNAEDAAGTWFEEQRDLVADFLRAFGDEAKAPPPATALFVGGDSDNTQSRSVAHIADIKLELRPQEARPRP